MTDIEILRAVGINMAPTSFLAMLFKAMAQARADEHVQVGSDINVAIMNGDFPHVCEGVADFVVRGKK